MKLAKKLVLMCAVLPLVLSSVSVMAFGGKGQDKGGHPFRGKCSIGMDKRALHQLDLTDEQKEQLKQLRSAGEKSRKVHSEEGFSKMQSHQQAVQQLVLADTFDENTAFALATQMIEVQVEKRVKMLAQQHKAMSVLTEEQKEKLQALQQEKATRCAEKFSKRDQEK